MEIKIFMNLCPRVFGLCSGRVQEPGSKYSLSETLCLEIG